MTRMNLRWLNMASIASGGNVVCSDRSSCGSALGGNIHARFRCAKMTLYACEGSGPDGGERAGVGGWAEGVAGWRC